MSVPFYYQGGNQFSATLKQTQHAVRTAQPKRYTGRLAKEKRMQDGKEREIPVTVPPIAAPMPAKARHEMFVEGKEFFTRDRS